MFALWFNQSLSEIGREIVSNPFFLLILQESVRQTHYCCKRTPLYRIIISLVEALKNIYTCTACVAIRIYSRKYDISCGRRDGRENPVERVWFWSLFFCFFAAHPILDTKKCMLTARRRGLVRITFFLLLARAHTPIMCARRRALRRPAERIFYNVVRPVVTVDRYSGAVGVDTLSNRDGRDSPTCIPVAGARWE